MYNIKSNEISLKKEILKHIKRKKKFKEAGKRNWPKLHKPPLFLPSHPTCPGKR